MCASYGLQTTPEELGEAFGPLDEKSSTRDLERWLEEFRDAPAKPTGVHARNLNPIVRERDRDGERTRAIELAWWKLWVGGAPAKFPAINARAENVVGSSAWGTPFAKRRILVPATEYHEKGRRFSLPEGIFAFAGLAALSKTEDGWMVSYAIVTHPAAEHIAEIHDRMPLILPRAFYGEWLDPRRVGDVPLLGEALALGRAAGDRLEVSNR